MAKVTAGNILRYQRVSFAFPVILILDENHSKVHIATHSYPRTLILGSMSDSDPSLPVSALLELDAQIFKKYGRTMMQDTLGVIIESIYCSAYGIFFAVAVYSILPLTNSSWSRKGLKSHLAIIILIVVYLYMAPSLCGPWTLPMLLVTHIFCWWFPMC
ncbi:hypothetical protein DFH08DRAFT_795764 [Mycena albidolilacea]|uniref:Uncharacterized protein n=1 Tax=Mycena albidolilacea TaxID=1033008 RepID=A0AAD7F623_9AGAR|nr:hypothetical protein DFH08DRAFT_795764 [Mycena albidolilacea]